MEIQDVYDNRLVLYDKIEQARKLIESCQEVVEDFTDQQIVKHWRKINSDLFELAMALSGRIPRRCSCGSFEFEKKQVVVVEGNNPVAAEIVKYFCLKCGTELSKSEASMRYENG